MKVPWAIVITFVPEVVRGVFSIVREHISRKRAEADARKAEAEAEAARAKGAGGAK